jgi:superfamily II DNA or RNA helicase
VRGLQALASDSETECVSAVSTAAALEISVREAAPWPALEVCVQIAVAGGRARALAASLDPIDALLLRVLKQQRAIAENTYFVGAAEFAPVLALLRQRSPSCAYGESERVAQVTVLAAPVEPVLELLPPDGTPARDDQYLRLAARVSFQCPELERPVGQPVVRTATYWTFETCVSPAPVLPDDPVLRRILDGSDDAAKLREGAEALDLLARARAAAHEGRLAIRLDERLRRKHDAQTAERRQSVTPAAVSFDAHGNLRITNPGGGERVLSGDAVADFLLAELPALRAGRAAISPDVEAASVCAGLRPSISVNGAAEHTDRVRVQCCFRSAAPACGGVTPQESFTPEEVLEAARAGRRFLRRGNLFVRVDRDAALAWQKQLTTIESLTDESGEARDEAIPELLVWARDAARDAQSPWNIYVADAVDGAHSVKDETAALRLVLDAEDEDGSTWFTLDASFDHGGEVLTEDELRRLVRQGRRWFRRGNAWLRVNPAALRKLEQHVHEGGLRRHHAPGGQPHYRFRPAARERVTQLFSLAGTITHAERYGKFLEQLQNFDRIEHVPLPDGLNVDLRAYQRQGYEWLAFLARYRLNGILADDMGLGKTAQTVALLAHMKAQRGPAPSLVVAPTSLLDNWRAEIARFCPGLRVMAYRGSRAQRDLLRRQASEHDVVLGAYATVRNDASLLREVPWRHVILDEAHFIKNSAAATTKAIKTIPSEHRLALTGTPVQNRLTELWSLFDFLMPGFLGRQMRFREQYEEPIVRLQSGRAETNQERDEGEDATERLRQRIRPFVLRRIKADVATELPPKIENDIFCRLTPEQAALYRGFAESAEAKTAVDELVARGPEQACAAILSALVSLRKICNHADLMCLPKNAGRQHIAAPLAGFEERSGKLEALGELMEQCREGGHRALIFCQLTTMLDLIAHYLDRQQVSWLRLDGETPGCERQKVVNRFNADASINACLISTRAGGTGLNLTGADTVIFADHDWNPANDQQAQDRAYRIGQQRTVMVYRLICRGTFEEKILRRQALKRALAASIIQTDAAGFKDLTRDELVSLFRLEA